MKDFVNHRLTPLQLIFIHVVTVAIDRLNLREFILVEEIGRFDMLLHIAMIAGIDQLDAGRLHVQAAPNLAAAEQFDDLSPLQG